MRFITLFSLFLIACSQPTPKPAENTGESAILKHKYWVNTEFNDALNAANVIDTLYTLPCSELVFNDNDTLLFTSCLSDAGRGAFKVTGPNTLEISMESTEGKPWVARFDPQTGILKLDTGGGMDPAWGKLEFVAHDNLMGDDPFNGIIQLARKRLAGSYRKVPQNGETASTALLELRPDGTQAGLGNYDQYEPYPTGIGGGAVLDKLNVMYLINKNFESEAPAMAWQLHGDTLRLWNLKNMNPDELPEYKIAGLHGVYVRTNGK